MGGMGMRRDHKSCIWANYNISLYFTGQPYNLYRKLANAGVPVGQFSHTQCAPASIHTLHHSRVRWQFLQSHVQNLLKVVDSGSETSTPCAGLGSAAMMWTLSSSHGQPLLPSNAQHDSLIKTNLVRAETSSHVSCASSASLEQHGREKYGS